MLLSSILHLDKLDLVLLHCLLLELKHLLQGRVVRSLAQRSLSANMRGRAVIGQSLLFTRRLLSQPVQFGATLRVVRVVGLYHLQLLIQFHFVLGSGASQHLLRNNWQHFFNCGFQLRLTGSLGLLKSAAEPLFHL